MLIHRSDSEIVIIPDQQWCKSWMFTSLDLVVINLDQDYFPCQECYSESLMIIDRALERGGQSGVVHSWKSLIICLTEVIFPEYQCDFRYRASSNSRYMSRTWIKVFGTEQFPFFHIFLLAEKRPSKWRNEYTGKCQYIWHSFPFSPLAEKGLQKTEMSTQVTARKKYICSYFSNFVKNIYGLESTCNQYIRINP